MTKRTRCDGPNCERTWQKLPKRGLVLLSTGKGKRYRYCTQWCLEQALLAGLGKRWYEPPGKRDFRAAYWRGHLKRCCAVDPVTLELTPPWPRGHEDALQALAKLRDAIKPGQLDRMLAATMKEIRKAAQRVVS